MLEIKREILVGFRSCRFITLCLAHLVLTVLLPRLGAYSFEIYGMLMNWVVAVVVIILQCLEIARDVAQGYWVLPMTLGKRCKGMVLARMLVYGGLLVLLSLLSVVLVKI